MVVVVITIVATRVVEFCGGSWLRLLSHVSGHILGASITDSMVVLSSQMLLSGHYLFKPGPSYSTTKLRSGGMSVPEVCRELRYAGKVLEYTSALSRDSGTQSEIKC